LVTAIVLVTCEVDQTPETAQALADLDGIRKVKGVETTRTLIAFRTYSRHDLDQMFSVGFEAGQPD
jgi:hypothetical protein